MKNYKDFGKEYIGSSDIATLILVGCRDDNDTEEGLKIKELRFGGDGAYTAYIVDETAEIGKHYQLLDTFYYWLKVYDDNQVTFEVFCDWAKVYTAGAYGCIIQIKGRE